MVGVNSVLELKLVELKMELELKILAELELKIGIKVFARVTAACTS